ncbi:MFS transporter [Paenibacillus oleatilyticus]|uniref:MFS transporter n=1 Tax=Paenibacillus oleatilyticus TaxID=2594886 RepID=A0ABV4V3C2_9BACL
MLNKNFLAFVACGMVSSIGDLIYFFVFSWYIASATHSVQYMGTIMLVSGITQFVASIFCGAWVDVWGAKKIIAVSNVIRALLMIGLMLVSTTQAPSLVVLLLIAIVFAITDASFYPAVETIKPQLVSEDHLSRMNGLWYTLARVLSLIAPSISALCMNLLGTQASFLCMAGCYTASALLLLFVRIQKTHTEPKPESGKWKHYTQSLTEGWVFIRNSRMMMTLLWLIFCVNIGANSNGLLLPFLMKSMNWDAQHMSYIYTWQAAAGIVCGSLLSLKSVKQPSFLYVLLGFLGQGLAILTVCFSSTLVFLCLNFAWLSVCTALVNIFIRTMMQKEVPNRYMARVGSLFAAISMTSTPLSRFFTGFLTDRLGVRQMYFWAGAFEVIVVALFFMLYKQITAQPEVKSQTEVSG